MTAGAVSEVEIQLSERPDGFGFFYGTARIGDRVVRVNVMPPAYLWDGDLKLDDARPDPTHWLVYADGELIPGLSTRKTWARHWCRF